MWTPIVTLIARGQRLADGVGGLGNLPGAYDKLQNVQKTLQTQETREARYGDKITEDQQKSVNTMEMSAIKQFTDMFAVSGPNAPPELKTALEILAKVKEKGSVDATDLAKLKEAADAIKQKLTTTMDAPVTFGGPAPLSMKDAKNMDECVKGKPYLQSLATDPTLKQYAAGGTGNQSFDDLQVLQHKLSQMEPNKANAIRSELAYDMGLSDVRDKHNARVDQIDAQLAGKKPAAMTSQEKTLYKERILIDPDMALNAKVDALRSLGMNNEQIVSVLKTQQDKFGKELQQESSKFYEEIGGTKPAPYSNVIGNSCGLGSLGIKNLPGSLSEGPGIGLFQYSDNAIRKSVAGKGLESLTNTQIYPIADSNKETIVHLSTAGSEKEYKSSNVTLVVDGKSLKLNVHDMKAQPMGMPAGWKYDPATQTLTIPPGAKTLTVIQKSGTEMNGYPDVFQSNIVVFNANPAQTRVDLASNYEPGSFQLKPTEADKKLLDQLAMGITSTYKPGDKLTIDVRSYGPLDPTGFKEDNFQKTGQIKDYDSGANSKTNLAGVRLATLDYDPDSKTLRLESGTDPVKWGMSKAPELKPVVEKLVAAHKDAKPPLTENDVLSGLRAFAMLEELQGKLGKSPPAADVLKSAQVVIGTGPSGPIKLSYQQYEEMAKLAGYKPKS